MVEVQDKVILQQPEPFWGAVKGKTSYGWWITVTGLFAALIELTFTVSKEEFTVRPGEVYSWFGIMLGVSAVAAIGWLVFTNHTFSLAQKEFFYDAVRGRDRWASTALRSYLNQLYGTSITEKQAVHLMRYGYNTITRQHEGRTEYVRVQLRGLDTVDMTLYSPEYSVGKIPDVSLLSPKLVIIEEPQVPRMYEFFQD